MKKQCDGDYKMYNVRKEVKEMLKKIKKKYALADFYDNRSGDLVHASDDLSEIMKAARYYRTEVVDSGECLLVLLQWSSEHNGYKYVKTL